MSFPAASLHTCPPCRAGRWTRWWPLKQWRTCLLHTVHRMMLTAMRASRRTSLQDNLGRRSWLAVPSTFPQGMPGTGCHWWMQGTAARSQHRRACRRSTYCPRSMTRRGTVCTQQHLGRSSFQGCRTDTSRWWMPPRQRCTCLQNRARMQRTLKLGWCMSQGRSCCTACCPQCSR